MYQPGDIVEIVPTADDEISQHIAGSIAEVVALDSILPERETYTISFINLTNNDYKRSLNYWQPKNLNYANSTKEADIDEKDIMSLLEDDNR